MLISYISKINQKIKQDKHFEELIKGAGTAFVLKVLGIISGYAFTLLVTRTLGAEAWGIFTLCISMLQIISIIGRLGMDTIILKCTAEYTDSGNIENFFLIYFKVIKLLLPLSILLSFLFYFFSPILACKFFNKAYLKKYFHIISFGISPLVFLWLNSEGIRGLRKIKYYIFFQHTGIFVLSFFNFIVGLLIMGKIVSLPILSYIISIILLSILTFIIFFKFVLLSYNGNKDKLLEGSVYNFSYKSLLFFSLPLLFSNILSMLLSWMDNIMIGILKTERELGIYNVVCKLTLPFSLIWISVNSILTPKIVQLKNNKKKLQTFIKNSAKIIFIFSTLYFIFLLIFGTILLKIFGEEFVSASQALIILSFGYFSKNIFGPNIDLMNILNLRKQIFLINIMAIIINFSLNIKLIPKFGISGAAISTSVSLLSAAFVRYIVVRRKLNISTLPF